MTCTDQIAKARAVVAKILEVEPAEINDHADFRADLDADSLQLAEIGAALEDELGLETEAPPGTFAEIRDLLAAEAAA
ncbi:acyl carrier protein [Glycomyces dulcitolivorans]|jgi:acyl carrier protein|uniref:acyl carrier protein n=1 Tax=Glycomyces dulcitolivorans TaxID=2200759 RepID=UPI000DD46A11|nr:phosphopantetheine-binding protein [Glycomyces dulcitolivorans]